jgi:hypothetical protein
MRKGSYPIKEAFMARKGQSTPGPTVWFKNRISGNPANQVSYIYFGNT